MLNKVLTYCKTLLLIAFVLCIVAAKANHISASTISYSCLGNDQYEITVNVYRDCSGISVANSVSVKTVSSCGVNFLLCSLDTIVDISQVCSTVVSDCAGGSQPGLELCIYKGILQLNAGCRFNSIIYADCCRGVSNNLKDESPPSLEFVAIATLDSSAAYCNRSPFFTSTHAPAFFVGRPAAFNIGAIDEDGDSLSFSLVAPMDQQGNALEYQDNYTNLNPLPTVSGFNFNKLTGQILFTPSQQGVFVVNIKVNEYRDGVFIGSIISDFQIKVIAANNNTPLIDTCILPANVMGAVDVSCNLIKLCSGGQFRLTVGIKDINIQPLNVITNIAYSLPGATLSIVQAGSDSVTAIVTWTPNITDIGFHYFTIQASDNSCPVKGVSIVTYIIHVQKSAYVGIDRVYCLFGEPVTVTAAAGAHYSWLPTTGIVNANNDSSIVQLAPTVTTNYIVYSAQQNNCSSTDTITVSIVNSITAEAIASEDTICFNRSIVLMGNATPLGEGPFIYSWTATNGTLSAPTEQTTIAKPTGIVGYSLVVTSSTGCVVKDSVQVSVVGIAPLVKVFPSSNYICPGSSVTLNTSVSLFEAGVASPTSNSCLPGSNFMQQTVGSDIVSQADNCTPFIGNAESGHVQYLYRASELRDAGLTAGTITQIGFNVSVKNSNAPYNDFTLQMGTTSLNSQPDNYSSNLVTVLQPRIKTIVQGWNTDTLDVPFNWDGFSNIIVSVCFHNGTFSESDEVLYTPTSYYSVLWGARNSIMGSGCNIIYGEQNYKRPNTMFAFCQPPLNYNVTWASSDGSILPDSLNPVVVANKETTYTVFVSDTQCMSSESLTIYCDSSVVVSAGNDTIVCQQPVPINANLPQTTSVVCIDDYTLSSIAPAMLTPSVSPIVLSGSDEGVSSAIALPFQFDFFCNQVQNVYIHTNGFLAFMPYNSNGCCTGQLLPSSNYPNNVVSMCWYDLTTLFGSGSIDYFVAGNSPNRIFVVRWNHVRAFIDTTNVTGQIQLYEGTDVIEVHIESQNIPLTQIKTLGIENEIGSKAIWPAGYNASGWQAQSPIAFRFTPNRFTNNLVSAFWTPALGLSSDTVLNPSAMPQTSTDYVLTASFANGCVTNDTVTVAVDTTCQPMNCMAYFTVYPDDQVAHNWFALNQSVGNGALSYIWYWGDGDSSVGATPSHIYSIPGYYNICLNISDSSGCTDTYCDTSTYIYKAEETITINCLLASIVNNADAFEVNIFPNPACNMLMVETGGRKISALNLHSISGGLVNIMNVPVSPQIDISYLIPGVYIAEIIIDNTSIRKRFVKM